MRRDPLWMLLLLLAVLATKCSDNGGDASPGTNGGTPEPSGFTCEFDQGDPLGMNGCRLAQPVPVYPYSIWMDWWVENTQNVDSVAFVLPVRCSRWYHVSGECIEEYVFDFGDGGPVSTEGPLVGNCVANHFTAYTSFAWLRMNEELPWDPDDDWWDAWSLIIDSSRVATAHVFWKDGKDSIYRTYPTPK